MKEEKMPIYEVKGSVRGRIYKGRGLVAALRALKRDRQGCKKQGGYSDCSLYIDGDVASVSTDDDGNLFVEDYVPRT